MTFYDVLCRSTQDFYRVCFSMGVLDTNGRQGIPRGSIALIFQDITRNMQQKLSDREALKRPFRRKSPKKGSKERASFAPLGDASG